MRLGQQLVKGMKELVGLKKPGFYLDFAGQLFLVHEDGGVELYWDGAGAWVKSNNPEYWNGTDKRFKKENKSDKAVETYE